MPHKISIFTNNNDVTAEELLSNKLIEKFAAGRADIFTKELGKPSNYAKGPTKFDLMKGTSFFIAHDKNNNVLGGLVLSSKEKNDIERDIQFFINYPQNATKALGELFKNGNSGYIYGVYKNAEYNAKGVVGDLYKAMYEHANQTGIDVVYAMNSDKNVEAAIGNAERYGKGFKNFAVKFNADSIFDTGKRYFRLPVISVSENMAKELDVISKSSQFVKAEDFLNYFSKLKTKIAAENEGQPDPKKFTMVDMARNFWNASRSPAK